MKKDVRGKCVITRCIAGFIMACVYTMPIAANAQVSLNIKDSTGTDSFIVTDSGHVGIGTNTPAAPIHVKANGEFPTNTIRVEGTPATGGGGFLCYNNNGTTAPGGGDRLGFFYFGSSYDGSLHHSAGFAAYPDGGWTANSTPAKLIFSTTAIDSTTRLDRMTITSSGNVGINTTTPTQQLEVNGAIRLNPASNPSPALICNSSTRGTIQIVKGGVNVADVASICVKDASENYKWESLF